jgi:hypothetical protein
MTWHVTMLFVHLAALGAVVVLFRQAPDRIQRIVLGLLACSQAIIVGAYVCALTGAWWHWMVLRMGYELEHIAVLVYVLRLFVADQERRCLPSFSAPSRAS